MMIVVLLLFIVEIVVLIVLGSCDFCISASWEFSMILVVLVVAYVVVVWRSMLFCI